MAGYVAVGVSGGEEGGKTAFWVGAEGGGEGEREGGECGGGGWGGWGWVGRHRGGDYFWLVEEVIWGGWVDGYWK